MPSLNHFYDGREKLSNISSQTDRKLQLHLVHRNLFNEKLRDWIPKWLKLITFPLSLSHGHTEMTHGFPIWKQNTDY